MTSAGGLFDPYTFRARVQPGVLVVLPVVLASAAWTAPVVKPLGVLIGSIVILAAFGTLLAEVARDAGLRAEEQLKKAWGGLPTLLRLRHRNVSCPSDARSRLHATLRRVVPGLILPTKLEETAKPVAADKAYDSAILWLRERTRDASAFPLVLAENAGYGYRRNAYGLRTAGLACALLGVAMGLVLASGEPDTSSSTFASAVVVTLLNGYLLAYWFSRVTPEAVRAAAERYADRLFGAAETLPDAAK